MKCPECGHEMSIQTKDIPYTYKGESTLVKDVEGKYCPNCQEFILSGDETQRVSDTLIAFNKRINSAIIDPCFVSNVRKKLKLSQKEANKLFGGGPNAFSRYETGKALPPQSLIQLLLLLNKHPELLGELKDADISSSCNGVVCA